MNFKILLPGMRSRIASLPVTFKKGVHLIYSCGALKSASGPEYLIDPWPTWYGLSYHEMTRDVVVLHPIPINLIVGAWVRFYRWAKIGFYKSPSRDDKGVLK